MGTTMNLKPALKLSAEIAPAEAALSRAETLDELQDAWFVHCDNFNGARREQLQSVYDRQLTTIRIRQEIADDVLAYARTL